jgi:hypothetical protein
MADISEAAQANSNQLNAMDIMGCEPVLTVEQVRLTNESGKKTAWIHYHGCNGRPWRVSTGMVRILMAGWGNDSDHWIGKSVQVFMEPTVKYAGKEVGGIRIRAMSDINARGINATLTISRTQRVPYPVKFLSMERPQYPVDQFESALPVMSKAMQDGKMTLEQVIARCQQTGDLSQEQLKRLSEAAPVSVDMEE